MLVATGHLLRFKILLKMAGTYPPFSRLNISMSRTILRNDQLATKLYGANNPGQPMTMIPKIRYMFYVNFVLNGAAPSMDNTNFLSNLGKPGIEGNVSFKVKTIDKPKVDPTVVELNQYNRKRLVYSKVEYMPFTIKLHDSVDSAVVKLWKDYFTYYFADSRTKSATDLGYTGSGPTGSSFVDSSGWGLRPIAEDTNFFTRIELYSLFGGKYQMTAFLNPRITNIDFEQYDSSSSDPEEVSITFKYEALEYNEVTTGIPTNSGFDLEGKEQLNVPATLAGATTDQNTTNYPSQYSNSWLDGRLNNLPYGQSGVIAPGNNSIVVNAPAGFTSGKTEAGTFNGFMFNPLNNNSSSVPTTAGNLNFGTY